VGTGLFFPCFVNGFSYISGIGFFFPLRLTYSRGCVNVIFY